MGAEYIRILFMWQVSHLLTEVSIANVPLTDKIVQIFWIYMVYFESPYSLQHNMCLSTWSYIGRWYPLLYADIDVLSSLSDMMSSNIEVSSSSSSKVCMFPTASNGRGAWTLLGGLWYKFWIRWESQ